MLSSRKDIKIPNHFSEVGDLCSMKCSSESLLNWLYFMHKITGVVFFTHEGKNKVA